MMASWVTAGFSIHPFYTILDMCTKFANLPSMLLKRWLLAACVLCSTSLFGTSLSRSSGQTTIRKLKVPKQIYTISACQLRAAKKRAFLDRSWLFFVYNSLIERLNCPYLSEGSSYQSASLLSDPHPLKSRRSLIPLISRILRRQSCI